MLLNHDQIQDILEMGIITGWKEGAINAASLDIHLGDHVLIEQIVYPDDDAVVDFRARQPLKMNTFVLPEDGFVLRPGQFILAQSVEVFNLPNDISAEYKLKSSMARIGLEHLHAGWCDAGWNGSVLTLELKNVTQYHYIRLRPGDAIGQMVFFNHDPVEEHQSYATKGRYNGDTKVSGIKE